VKVQAIIPARGGSKGIPRKNLIEVCGKPLIAYTIEDAQRAPEISEVIVSTDSEEIAVLSKRLGATVVIRPPEISGDLASSESALLHCLDVLRDRQGHDPDLVVFLQATSPVRPVGAISGAIEAMVREQADSLFSASPIHGFVWRMDPGGPMPLNYDHRSRPRRQNFREHIEENGSIYVFRPWVLRDEGNRLGGRIVTYLMDPLYAVQVDEPDDLEKVSRIIEICRHETDRSLPDPVETND
jgi:N-acylneuraminate cytidylyltransferase